jgi:hypothetical protein
MFVECRKELLKLQKYLNLQWEELYTDKKENQIFRIYKEIQSGAVAK